MADPYALYAKPTKEGPTPKQVRAGQEITKGSLDIQTETAKAPFAGPQAATNLQKDKLQVIRDAKTYGRDLRKEFDGTEAVKVYREGMRYFTTALRTPPNPAGDQDLVTLAAKVQDPTGAVMQGDIDRYNNIQVALERLPQQFRNEFEQSGKFSEKTRRDIRAFLTNRVLVQRDAYNDTRKSYTTDLEDFNAQTSALGVKPLDTTTILGTHPATLYKDKILAYDATQKAADKIADRSGLMSAPEGMRISGEDVKGFRFSPEAESKINAYTKSEDATAEGYAKLLADAAVKEGFIDEGQRGNYEAQTAIDNAKVFEVPPAQRGGIDYKAIDEAASKNAGLFETVAQAGRNLPESAAQLVTGLGSMIANPIETIKTTADLAGALLQGDTKDPTVQAAAKVLEEQYGGLDNVQRYLIKDPLAFLGDASMLLSGSGFALKTAGLTRLGEGVSTAGRVIDPLSGVVSLATDVPAAAYQKAKTVAPNVVTGIERLPGEAAGFLPGVGGASVDTAASAGFARGRAGAPTPASEAFTEAMRNPERTAEDVVAAAQGIVGTMREQASRAYSDEMAKFGRTPTPLDIGKVQQRVQQLKPRSYDTWSSRKGERPADHLAWEKMNSFVDEYAQKAAADPNLLLPLSMDQFKRDVYDIGSKINGAVDSKAAGIAKQTYNAVRQELVNHDDLYAKIMRDYEKAVNEAQQIEKSFSLGSAASVDTSARKLQSIFRNNVNTGFGARTAQAERMFEMDPTGVLEKTLAGQTVSAFPPRGISKVSPALGKATLLAAPFFSPRAVGEMAYGAGRVAGTGARAFDAITGSKAGQGLTELGTGLAELYQKYPELFLAGTQAGTMLDKIDAQALADKYIGAPVVPAGSVPAEEQITVTGTRSPAKSIDDLATQYEIPSIAVAPVAEADVVPEEGVVMFGDRQVKYDPATDTYLELTTGRRVKDLNELSMPSAAMYRGGTVQAFRNGGNKGETRPASYAGNVGRSILEGLTFNNAGELEAAVRAHLLRQGRYRDLKTAIEGDYSGFKSKNPGAALAGELGGAIVPGVVGAFVPGGQGATLSTLGRVGRAMAEPVTVATRRFMPNAGAGLQRALPYLDEGVTGVVQSIGSANTMRDAPRQIAEDAPLNIAGSLGVRGVNVGIKKGVDKFRGRKKATGGLAVKKGARK
jgi:hypothetical protein